MEAIFKVKAAEFNSALIEKIKDFLSLTEDGYVTVSIRDEEPVYSEKLLRSKVEMETPATNGFLLKETREEYFTRLDKAIKNSTKNHSHRVDSTIDNNAAEAEKALLFFNQTEVDMIQFVFDREEANAR